MLYEFKSRPGYHSKNRKLAFCWLPVFCLWGCLGYVLYNHGTTFGFSTLFSMNKSENRITKNSLFRFLSEPFVTLFLFFHIGGGIMHNYSAIIVNAYSSVSGRSISDSISDLGLDGVIDSSEVESLSEVETDYLNDMLKNGQIVRSWQKVAG